MWRADETPGTAGRSGKIGCKGRGCPLVYWAPVGEQVVPGAPVSGAESRVRAAGAWPLWASSLPGGVLINVLGPPGIAGWPGGARCSRTPSREGLRGQWARASVLSALGAIRMHKDGPRDVSGEVTGTLQPSVASGGLGLPGAAEARARHVSKQVPESREGGGLE